MQLTDHEQGKMSLLKFIVSAVPAIIFLYFTITGIQNVMQAQKEVEQAEKEYTQAEKEYIQARKEFDNTVKYGCPNPIVSAGGIIC